MANTEAPTLLDICSLHFATIIGNGRVPPIDCSLPPQIGDSVVAGLRKIGLLNPNALEILAQTTFDITKFDFSRCGVFPISALSSLKKYSSLKFLNLSRCDQVANCGTPFDLEEFVNTALNASSAKSLTGLHIGGHTHVISLSALKHLTGLVSLNLCCRLLGQESLKEIATFSPKLRVLDISGTSISDITPLEGLANLEVLMMHNVKILSGSFSSTLASLKQLRYLDISRRETDAAVDGAQESSIDMSVALVEVLKQYNHPWPHLGAVDLSGNSLAGLGVDQAMQLIDFIIEKCPQLMSVAVLATPLDNTPYAPACTDRFITVYNCATRQNSLQALEHYWNSERDIFCSHALHAVYFCLQSSYDEFSQDDIKLCVHLVCKAMKRHSGNLAVQMAGSACMYHLCKMKRIRRLTLLEVQHCMDRCLDAAEAHQHQVQLQKNVWLTICNDYLLQLPGVDFYRTCKVALESMLSSRDASVARMTIAIVSIVTPKMRPPEARELTGDARYVRHLVRLMDENLKQLQNSGQPHADTQLFTLKFTLSALWNLTDESSQTSKVFDEAGGVGICFEIMKTFSNHYNIQTKVLGILNNVAEVEELAYKFTEDRHHIQILMECLAGDFSECAESGRNRGVERSYFAAGVLSNLLVIPVWSSFTQDLKSIVNNFLMETMMSWPDLKGAMVSYRSFLPFVRIIRDATMLHTKDGFALHQGPTMWCLWGVHHVLSHKEKNSASMRYLTMLTKSGLDCMIRELIMTPLSNDYVRKMAERIHEIVMRLESADEVLSDSELNSGRASAGLE